MKNTKTQTLAECAIMLALASVLSMFTMLKMPMEGSVTPLSMLPVVLIAIKHGVKIGLPVSFLYSLIQFALSRGAMFAWGITPAAIFGTITLDYIAAYTVLGFAGMFKNVKNPLIGQVIGIVTVLAARFVLHFASGIIIFGQWAWEGWNPVLYSICYNGIYMLPEMIFTVVGAVVFLKAPYVRKLFAPN